MRQDAGSAATEYGILVAFLVLVILVGVSAFGTALNGFIGGLGETLRAVLG